MKFILNEKEIELIPYKSNPEIWWDGIDSNKLYKFSDLKQPTVTKIINSNYSAVRATVKIGVRAGID